MASSGQLDVGKLASDLGVGGGRSLDLGQVASTLTGGGSQANQVVSALSRQTGGIGNLLGNALNALKSPTGLAVGGAAALAAAGGVGALLWKRSQGGEGGGISETLSNLIPGGSEGGGLASLLGGSNDPSDEEASQYRQMAEQLPQARPDQLIQGAVVLALFDQNDWRPGKLGWVDGGQARVTFENGLEKWCNPPDIRVPPSAGAPPDNAAANVAPAAPVAQPSASDKDDPFADLDDDPFK